MKGQKKKQKQKGITLIALVISIIVMLILAGVSLNAIIGDNGILTQARTAVGKTRQAQALEEVTIAWTGLIAEYYSDWSGDTGVTFSGIVNKANLQKYVQQTGTIDDVTVETTDTWIIEYTSNDQNDTYMFLAEENGKVTFLDGLNVVPSAMSLQIINGTKGTKTAKAILTGISGTVNWTTGDSSIASISPTTGNEITVTGEGAGETTITATITTGGKTYTDTCSVTVIETTAITSITSLTPDLSTINRGSRTTITAVTDPTNATEVLEWTSSDEGIVSITQVSANGRTATVAGMSVGTATITARAANGETKTQTITVVEPATVTFKVDGATYATNNTTVGGTVGTLPTEPTKANYTFNGWYNATTGGTEYTASSTVNSSSLTLHAQWTAESYTITANITIIWISRPCFLTSSRILYSLLP